MFEVMIIEITFSDQTTFTAHFIDLMGLQNMVASAKVFVGHSVWKASHADSNAF